MTLHAFITATKLRLDSATPQYFKIIRRWMVRLSAAAIAIVAAADANAGFMQTMEHIHVYTAAQYVIAVGLTGILGSSLPSTDKTVTELK